MKILIRVFLILTVVLFFSVFQSESQIANKYPSIQFQCGNLNTPSAFDEAKVMFIPETSENVLRKYSCSKLFNSDTLYPNIFINYNNNNYAIKAFPIYGGNDSIVNIQVKAGYPGFYYIKVTSFKNFDDSSHVYLFDTDDSTKYEINESTTLYFPVEKDEFIDTFKLVYKPSNAFVTGINEFNIGNNIATWTRGNSLHVNYYNKENKQSVLKFYSITGSEIKSPEILNNGNYSFHIDNLNGIYILKLTCEGKTTVRKVVITQ